MGIFDYLIKDYNSEKLMDFYESYLGFDELNKAEFDDLWDKEGLQFTQFVPSPNFLKVLVESELARKSSSVNESVFILMFRVYILMVRRFYLYFSVLSIKSKKTEIILGSRAETDEWDFEGFFVDGLRERFLLVSNKRGEEFIKRFLDDFVVWLLCKKDLMVDLGFCQLKIKNGRKQLLLYPNYNFKFIED